jgi:hypothetical protein
LWQLEINQPRLQEVGRKMAVPAIRDFHPCFYFVNIGLEGVGGVAAAGFVTILQCARLRQATWAASLHKKSRCGSGGFDVRYIFNSGAKPKVAGCPSWD